MPRKVTEFKDIQYLKACFILLIKDLWSSTYKKCASLFEASRAIFVVLLNVKKKFSILYACLWTHIMSTFALAMF